MAPAEELIDRLAIRDLLENWAVWRDAADWERFSTLWHEGGA
jgi:SnoaL-like domain